MAEAMEWSDVKVFLAVARAGSLGGAARLTGQSQPTMGRRLKALETAVGHALFQRGSEGFVPTAEGAAVLAHAERMEEEALAFQRRLDGQEGQLEGQLRVSSSDWFGVYVLGPVFARFVQQHPGVGIELLTDSRLFSLARREADIVFRIRPFDGPEVVQRKLMHVAYHLYAPQGTPPLPPDHQGQGLALVTLDTAYRDFPDVVWLRQRLPLARIAIGSNSREAQARMCAAGAGLAVLPAAVGDATPGLQRMEGDSQPPGRDVWLGFHRDLRRLARLRALVEATVEGCGAAREA